MRNMMKEYLGDGYSNNYVRNFCLYWIKASQGSSSKWRKKNDLDCLYYNGDLRADTLMSAWTPVKWVADLLNKETGKVFIKHRKDCDDPLHDLKLLAEDTDAYLPPKHKLVIQLNEFLKLAEQAGNYILLPDNRMNCSRYRIFINGRDVWLFDEVPATLAHLFDKDSLGRYFPDENGNVDLKNLKEWLIQEKLTFGFEDGIIDKDHIKSLVKGLDPYEAKWLTEENEISEALEYMTSFLTERNRSLGNEEV